MEIKDKILNQINTSKIFQKKNKRYKNHEVENIFFEFQKKHKDKYMPVVLFKVTNQSIETKCKQPLKFHHLQNYQDLLNRLSELLQNYSFPNTTFLVTLRDYYTPSEEIDFPIFTYSKNKTQNAMVLPDYETIRGLNKKIEAIYEKDLNWEEKKRQGVFRGSANAPFEIHEKNWKTNSRMYLSAKSQRKELREWADIGITKFGPMVKKKSLKFFREHIDLQPFMNWGDQIKFQFIIALEGVTYGFEREPLALISNSLLIKENSNGRSESWFEGIMRPYIVYFDPFHIHAFKDLLKKQEGRHNLNAKVLAQKQKEIGSILFKKETVDFYIYSLINKYQSHYFEK